MYTFYFIATGCMHVRSDQWANSPVFLIVVSNDGGNYDLTARSRFRICWPLTVMETAVTFTDKRCILLGTGSYRSYKDMFKSCFIHHHSTKTNKQKKHNEFKKQSSEGNICYDSETVIKYWGQPSLSLTHTDVCAIMEGQQKCQNILST